MTRCLLPAIMAVGALANATAGQARREVVNLSPAQAAEWLRHVIPLPKRVDLRGKMVIDPASVAIVHPTPADELTDQAGLELQQSLHLPDARANAAGNRFALTLQLGGPEALELERLKNGDQAYRIFPEPEYRGLRLVALTSRGLYYASRTLSQLTAPRATDERVEIPILRVTDWPDIAERGLWGADSFLELRWLADCKMNIVEQIAAVSVDEEGRGNGRMKPGREPMIEEGPRYGIQPVPAVLHLNQLKGKGLFEVYPELVAEGGDEGAICYSREAIVGVLADWIVALGRLPGVPEVSVWLTENLHGKGGCQCENCCQHDRNVLETRVALKAWQRARERLPQVGLRLLLSEETYHSNGLILQEVPWEVKVTYYHSLLTYTVSHQPMIDPLLADYAARGRWLGVTPQLSAAVGRAAPFTGAHFVHARINEFAEQGIACFTGYATPRLKHARFNVEAAAEWSWNAGGRTPREFAVSYAVRHGLADPEAFAEWSETVGPVEWRLYGSEWPAGEMRRALKSVVQALRDGTLPELGEVQLGVYRFPWADYNSPEQLAEDLAAARKAVALASDLGGRELIEESLATEGSVQALNSLWALKQIVGPDGVPPGDRETAQRHFGGFVGGCEGAASAIEAWALMVEPEIRPNAEGRYWQLVEALEKSAREMAALAEEMGAPCSAE